MACYIFAENENRIKLNILNKFYHSAEDNLKYRCYKYINVDEWFKRDERRDVIRSFIFNSMLQEFLNTDDRYCYRSGFERYDHNKSSYMYKHEICDCGDCSENYDISRFHKNQENNEKGFEEYEITIYKRNGWKDLLVSLYYFLLGWFDKQNNLNIDDLFENEIKNIKKRIRDAKEKSINNRKTMLKNRAIIMRSKEFKSYEKQLHDSGGYWYKREDYIQRKLDNMASLDVLKG